MSPVYSGAVPALEAKQLLGDALGALQADPNPPAKLDWLRNR